MLLKSDDDDDDAAVMAPSRQRRLISEQPPEKKAHAHVEIYLRRIPKRPILLISPIRTLLKPSSNPISRLTFPLPIISPTQIPITRHNQIHQTPIHQRTNHPSAISRRLRPQLRRRNTPRTIPDKKHGIDASFFRISSYITRG